MVWGFVIELHRCYSSRPYISFALILHFDSSSFLYIYGLYCLIFSVSIECPFLYANAIVQSSGFREYYLNPSISLFIPNEFFPDII